MTIAPESSELAAKAPSSLQERRLDPDDGQVCTWEELCAKHRNA
eukprot:CAMPEP_0180624478 /NCGR_PEP_ID=MMETSP1037_2-20121125/36802_1 /TAXON_ID=632150 /ORGANISM="Azadinium spinosum, Strain 3D9" /LENGTH=43 /DNA_ID= /DNA_START= /DNA_END= /DNA_ORIENTATION=